MTAIISFQSCAGGKTATDRALLGPQRRGGF
jgi:hypothetical protein